MLLAMQPGLFPLLARQTHVSFSGADTCASKQPKYRTWMVKPLSECCVNIVVTEGIPTTSVTPDYISEITHWNEAS